MNQQGPPGGPPPDPGLGPVTTGALVIGGIVGIGVLVSQAAGKDSPTSP